MHGREVKHISSGYVWERSTACLLRVCMYIWERSKVCLLSMCLEGMYGREVKHIS